MNCRRRVALVLAALVFAAAAQMAPARSVSLSRFGEQRGSALTSLTHHGDSAVVPANPHVRGSRTALGELLSVPLADVFAFVALLALWFTASVRRRDRLASAVVTYRRRGPPALLPVI